MFFTRSISRPIIGVSHATTDSACVRSSWIHLILLAVVGVYLNAWTSPVFAQETTRAAELEAARDPLNERRDDVLAVPTAIAQFTTGIEKREPVDQISFVKNDVRKIYFFSDLRNLDGETVSHQWSYEGRVIAVVPFEVRGPRWRVWSSKEMKPDWTGDWIVEILKSDGEVVAAETFSYTQAED